MCMWRTQKRRLQSAQARRPQRRSQSGESTSWRMSPTIAEADIGDVSSIYDARLGPRNVITLTNIVVHAGAPLPEATFSQLGGQLPSGGYIEVDHLTRFAVGERYILFFARQASLYTAVWARLAFRVEKLATKSIVLGPDGFCVRRFGLDGVQFGSSKFLSAASADSLAAPSFNRAAAESDPEVASALTPEDLVAAAIEATAASAAPIGADISFRPDPAIHWDAVPTTAQ